MLDDFGSEMEAIEAERLDADLLMAEMEAAGPPARRRQGWVYGICDSPSGRYLTVVGSFYREPDYHATREAAEAALEKLPMRDWSRPVGVAHITGKVGCVYRMSPGTFQLRSERLTGGEAAHAGSVTP